ncbi:MAG TPA: CvpA family protein [Gaiellales bacterium]|nr:CvpA family protein [Gaiellales bacterium]
MTVVDVIVLCWIAIAAAQGARRGLVANALGFAGFAAGAIIGSRLAAHFLVGGDQSTWLPLIGLIGAIVGGLLVQRAAGTVAAALRPSILRGPLAAVDTAGGLALGAALGAALVWLVAVLAIEQPNLGLRNDVQSSTIMPALLRAVPASTVLNELARLDPLPVLPSIADRTLPPPAARTRHLPAVLRAARSVVRITGESCGLGVEGSGWVVAPGLVVTNAHVVAGEERPSTTVHTLHSRRDLTATVVAMDVGNDIAVLRVPGLQVRPLRMASSDPSDTHVALIGYPHDGPLKIVSGTAGSPITALAADARGEHPHLRSMVPLRGDLEHGDSGGPVVAGNGRVVAMMFAADTSGGGGFGVPLSAIRAVLAGKLGHAVSTGGCI